MNLKFLSQQLFLVIVITLTINSVAIGQNGTRTINELTSDTSGWGVFVKSMKIAKNKFEILPADSTRAKEALYQTQVTTHSIMGAIIYFTGGILIDNGWIRILGSGDRKLQRSLPEWNKGKTYTESMSQSKFLLFADDVVGGFFAINNGGLGAEIGKVYYLAPDDLKWESLHIGYSEFIDFCFDGDMNQFYSGLRWSDWENDMKKMSPDKGFFIYPYPWTKEGKDIKSCTRKIVPIKELYNFEIDAIKQLSH